MTLGTLGASTTLGPLKQVLFWIELIQEKTNAAFFRGSVSTFVLLVRVGPFPSQRCDESCLLFVETVAVLRKSKVFAFLICLEAPKWLFFRVHSGCSRICTQKMFVSKMLSLPLSLVRVKDLVKMITQFRTVSTITQ